MLQKYYQGLQYAPKMLSGTPVSFKILIYKNSKILSYTYFVIPPYGKNALLMSFLSLRGSFDVPAKLTPNVSINNEYYPNYWILVRSFVSLQCKKSRGKKELRTKL